MGNSLGLLNSVVIRCDEAFLEVGLPAPMAVSDLFMVYRAKIPIIWEMLGLVRIVPETTISDLARVIEGHNALRHLGRSSEIVQGRLGFRWDQTLSFGEYLDDRGQVLDDESTNHADDSGPAENHPDQSLCSLADFH